MAFHDDYYWRPYAYGLELAVYNIAYPLAFAAMGLIGTAIVSHRLKTVSSAAVACAANGVVGGVIYSAAIAFLHARGYLEAISFVASVGAPAYLSARRISTLLNPVRLRDGVESC